ncbi:hypothetical protein [Modestobacter marinus]|nr:hypothetical protein [Modestobacter marinus]
MPTLRGPRAGPWTGPVRTGPARRAYEAWGVEGSFVGRLLRQ